MGRRDFRLESQAPTLGRRSIDVPRKKADGVEAMLRRADRTLDGWFRRSRTTTRQAAVVFARLLQRSKRGGAGALRHQVDELQGGLEKLSTGLEKLEHDGKPAGKKARPASSTRKSSRPRKQKAA
jgi:hypothetical protein